MGIFLVVGAVKQSGSKTCPLSIQFSLPEVTFVSAQLISPEKLFLSRKFYKWSPTAADCEHLMLLPVTRRHKHVFLIRCDEGHQSSETLSPRPPQIVIDIGKRSSDFCEIVFKLLTNVAGSRNSLRPAPRPMNI